MLIKTFAVGGIICVLGQLLIDYTSMTPARILVLFVTMGVVLTAVGLYEPLVKFAGSGATVPLTGFGYTLAKGAEEMVKEKGLLGALMGGRARRAAFPPLFCSASSAPWCPSRATNRKGINNRRFPHHQAGTAGLFIRPERPRRHSGDGP